MKNLILSIIISVTYICVSNISFGQSGLSMSIPTIWSKVSIKDNWTPITAPSYKEYREGTAFGYGLDFNYSFQPKFIISDKHFFLNVGVGYFNQTFNVTRPFNYNTLNRPIYYTDNYSYHNWQWIIGVRYTYRLNKCDLIANLSYTELKSFRQEYTPTYGPSSYGFYTQVNRQKIDFGKMLFFDVGLNKRLGDRFLIGLNIIVPVYTRWRNDTIFNDDPATFSKPEFSIGSSLHGSYIFKNKQSH